MIKYISKKNYNIFRNRIGNCIYNCVTFLIFEGNKNRQETRLHNG